MDQGTNFIALKATSAAGATIKCKFNGKTHTLDDDGIIVLQMTEAKKALTAEFISTLPNGDKQTVKVALSGLTLATE